MAKRKTRIKVKKAKTTRKSKAAGVAKRGSIEQTAPSSPTHVTNADIRLLSQDQLANLLWHLIYLEQRTHQIPHFDSDVPLAINVPDGGIDGLAKWSGGPDRTPMLPSRHVGFQSKADDLSASAAAKELLTEDKTLKPEVRKLLSAGGDYILFFKSNAAARGQADRVKAMVDTIRRASKRDGKQIKKPSVRVYGATKIAEWVNQYPAAIAFVDQILGRSRSTAKGWKEIAGYPEFANKYIAGDAKRDEAIQQMKTASYAPKSVVRVLGMSGLGKTRLVLEAFAPSPTFVVNERNANFCYFDSPEGAAQILSEWRNRKKSGLIIVDNCPVDRHNDLVREVSHVDSTFALLTIGNDLDKSVYGSSSVIAVEPANDVVIKGVLAEPAFEQLASHDKAFVEELAQGFPMMAVLVASAKMSAGDIAGRISPNYLAKLLGDDVKPGSTPYKIVSVCALFEFLGVAGTLQNEFELARQLCCPEVTKQEFFAGIKRFQQKGIIAPYGRLIQVRPPPLAIRLAADWWRLVTPDFVEGIVKAGWPEGMVNALCERVRMLDFVPELRETTKEMCGPTGPFGQAKVLLSGLGSRLFRAIAEVNPAAAMQALERVMEPLERSEVLAVANDVRRNLVWALEKLAFNVETFGGAARQLARLASAENEKWSNNSTGIFERLFQIAAAGTQATFAARLAILRDLIESDDLGLRAVAIIGAGNGLRTHGFIGHSGPEYQGSKGRLEEFKPKVYGEIFSYWRDCLALLAEAATSTKPYADDAAAAIASAIRGLVLQGRFDDLEPVLRKVAVARAFVWPAAISALRDSLRYDAPSFPEATRKRVESWLDDITPQELAKRLALHVTSAAFEHDEDEQGKWVDTAAVRAEALGREVGADWQKHYELLPSLLSGQQRQTYAFGKGLGEAAEHRLDLAERLAESLGHIPFNTRNSSLLSAVLAVIDAEDRSFVDAFLKKVAADKALQESLVAVTVGLKLTDERVLLVRDALRAGTIKVEHLFGLSAGRALSDITPGTVTELAEEMLRHGVTGAWAALDVGHMYVYSSAEKWAAFGPTLRKIITRPGMLRRVGRHPLAGHAFETMAEKLLPGDEPLADILIDQIVGASDDKEADMQGHDHLFGALVKTLLDTHPGHAWLRFGRALIEGKGLTQWRLSQMMRNRLGNVGEPGLLNRVPDESLASWCGEFPDKAPAVVAGMVQVIDRSDQEAPKLTARARWLVDNYGQQDSVLSALTANLHSFSWTGSLVPYYEIIVSAMRPLESHKYAAVRKWAKAMVKDAEQNIVHETHRQQEHEIGRY